MIQREYVSTICGDFFNFNLGWWFFCRDSRNCGGLAWIIQTRMVLSLNAEMISPAWPARVVRPELARHCWPNLTNKGFLQRQDMDQLQVFFSGDGEGHGCLVIAAMVVCSSIIACIFLVLCYLYLSQLCIRTIINTSNVCLRMFNVKKNKA